MSRTDNRERLEEMLAVQSPRFQLGKVVATQGAIEALTAAQTSAWELLSRHSIADFGEVDSDDWQANLDAIKDGERILSANGSGLASCVVGISCNKPSLIDDQIGSNCSVKNANASSSTTELGFIPIKQLIRVSVSAR